MDPFHEKPTEYLSGYLTDSRRIRINEIINLRTRYLTVVLEDVFKEHNASAVVRTCECLGLQDLHIIEDQHEYNVNRNVVMGSSKWINIHKHGSGTDHGMACYDALRSDGYRLAALTPEGKTRLEELDLSTKTAFIFGTEYAGLSSHAQRNADASVRLPVYGFTESYNLSVSVAITLSYAIRELRNSKMEWNLSDEEKDLLRLDFIRKTVRKSSALEKEFRKSLES